MSDSGDDSVEFIDAFFASMEEAGSLPPGTVARPAAAPPRLRPEDVERRLRTTEETLPTARPTSGRTARGRCSSGSRSDGGARRGGVALWSATVRTG